MEWMRTAGMLARMDPVGNVVGRYEGVNPGAPAVVLASHFDTVRDAGRYDGVLGILTAIECIATLRGQRRRFPFALEVYGFANEEGARFPISFIGSRATTGLLKDQDLVKTDSDGITLAEALLNFGLSSTRIFEAARQSDEMLAPLLAFRVRHLRLARLRDGPGTQEQYRWIYAGMDCWVAPRPCLPLKKLHLKKLTSWLRLAGSPSNLARPM